MAKIATPTLEERIATALSATDIKSADLVKLLGEAETAVGAADKAADEARTKALDPALSPDPEAARQSMQAAEFARDRLKTLQPRLQLRCRDVQEAERLAAWRQDFEQVRPIHEAMVIQFTERYPKLIDELAALMRRMARVDALVSSVLIARPAGVREHLDKVEVAVRGRLQQPDVSIPLELRLPYLFRDGGPIYAWPPEQKIDWSHPMFAPAQYNPLYSGDWAAAREQRQQSQQADFEQRETHYQRQEQQALERREQELREARKAAEARE